MIRPVIVFLSFLLLSLFGIGGQAADCPTRGTGDLGIIVERAAGSVVVVDTTKRVALSRIEGLGDLSHASAVYSRDERYAYLFGRDGGLSKVDLLCGKLVKRIVQGGNSIGGAISQDGTLIAVSNYEPGGVRVFSAQTLELVADIPATPVGKEKRSKTVGLVDAPGQRFVFALFDSGEIWVADLATPGTPEIRRFKGIGRQPYDALISPDGRYYLAGLFGEDGLALLDLWYPERGVKRVLNHYGRGKRQLPVYKMPHLEGWAIAGIRAFLPAIGFHELLVVETIDWRELGRVALYGQPVFAVARPDGRQIWVNFAFPHNDTVQVVDSESLKVIRTLKLGKGALHMEFTPRGEAVWISIRDEDRVVIYDTRNLSQIGSLPVSKPSGIFFTARAHKTGL